MALLYRLGAIALGLISLNVFAADAGFRYRDILNLIQSRESEGNPIQSVDDLLKAFPAELKAQFTLIYSTGNRFQDASPLYPRALVYSENLLYTFNGHPSQRGYQTLELMEFDRSKRRFEMREISFEGGKLKFSLSTPRKCLECHGSDPHPIWNAYDKWPGVYGSDDDHLRGEEFVNLQKFLAEVRRDPKSRYANLHFPEGTPIPPYGRRGGVGDEKFRMNLMLTKLVTRLNALRVARLFEESPNYTHFKWMLPDLAVSYQEGPYAGSFGCGLPGSARLSLAFGRMAQAYFPHRPPKREFPAIAFEAFGLSVERVTMHRGSTSYQYADGGPLFQAVLRNALLERLSASDEGLRSRVTTRQEGTQSEVDAYPLYRFINGLIPEFVDRDGQLASCSYISDQVDEELSRLEQMNVDSLVPARSQVEDFDSRLREAGARRASTAIPISCVYCHTVAGEAPRIPFDDTPALGRVLRAEGGRLLRVALARIDPESPTPLRMPPPSSEEFSALSKDESDRLGLFLKSLAQP